MLQILKRILVGIVLTSTSLSRFLVLETYVVRCNIQNGYVHKIVHSHIFTTTHVYNYINTVYFSTGSLLVVAMLIVFVVAQ